MLTAEKRFINIPHIEEYFIIEEDGAIWSKRKKKYLKPTFNTAGYLYVSLPLPLEDNHPSIDTRSYAVHRLVACKYIGQCPYGLETSHKDGDKMNNHYTNLEYLSHSANILKSFREHGRVAPYHPDYPRKPFSDHTKELMSDAKKKRVIFKFDGMEAIFLSIEDAALSLDTYRRKIYRCIKTNSPFKDKNTPDFFGYLSFLDE